MFVPFFQIIKILFCRKYPLLHLIITNSQAHVQHYKNLKRIEFDIYRNNNLIGFHKINVKKKGDNTKEVITDILIEVKILGIKVHTYKSYGVKTYKNDELINFK